MKPCNRIIIAACCVAVAALSARAAENEAIVIGQRRYRPTLTLDPFAGSINFTALYSNDRTQGTGDSQSNSNAVFQQTLELSTGGGVVSRNFLEWKGSLTLGLEEEWNTSSGTGSGGSGNSTSYGIVTEYDLSASLLPKSFLPTTYWARRDESFINRTFAALLRSTSTEYGASVTVASPQVPTTLRVYRSETTQSSLNGAPTLRLSQDNVDLTSQWFIDDHQRLSLTYQFTAAQQSDPNNDVVTTDTHRLSIDHVYAFDANNRDTLTSRLDYYTQEGTYPYERFRIDESLRLHHTDRFETFYNYSYSEQSSETSATSTHSGSAGFQHRLFESLNTVGRVQASQTSQSAGGGSEGYGADISSTYSKRTAIGRLTITGNLGMTDTAYGAGTAPQQIINEPYVFVDPLPIRINRQNIRPDSIVVFNSTGVIRYLEGIDYTVDAQAQFVEIRRVLGGNISNGDSVLISYEVDPQPAYDSGTTFYGIGVRFDFDEATMLNGLGIYANYYHQEQSLRSRGGILTLIPDNTTVTSVGAEYRIWKLRFIAEQEWRESTISPENSLRFEARYDDRFSNRSALTLTAAQVFTEFPNDNSRADYFLLSARYTYDLTRNLRATLGAEYRNDNDSRFGSTLGLQEQAELRWRFRQTEVYIQVRHSFLDSSGSETQSFLFQTGLTRSF